MIDFVLPANESPALLGDVNTPDNEYGGGEPKAFKAADGSRFWGTLAKVGGVLKYVVYRTNTAGVLISSWADSGIIGQGSLCLQADGTLEAVGYIAYGDGATIRAVPVPGWVAWPAQQGPRGPQGAQGLPGPKGDKGDPGPAGAGGALSDDDKRRLGWLATWLAPLFGG